MIKKVPVSALKPGMFIHDFNCAWRDDNPFPKQLLLKKSTQISYIRQQGLKELYIDTAKGLDVPNAPTAQEVHADLAAQIMELGDAPAPPPPAKFSSMEKELTRAAEVKKHARKLVGNVLEDARLGKQVAIGPVRNVVEGMVESMFSNQNAMLSLGQLKQRDEYTFLHSVNVGVFLMSFCRGLQMDEETIIDVGVGALLHDIGKMRTPQEVLNKPGKLSDDEFMIMRKHVEFSHDILSETEGVSQEALDVAGQHHERYDGSGYPHKLKGDQISLFGQMSALVDVYDAITSDRCYHKGMPPHVALRKMLEWSKHHFDLNLYHSFVRCVGIYPIGTLVVMENGLMGVVIQSNQESLLHPIVNVIYDTAKNRPLTPEIMDLLEYREKGSGYKIRHEESPARWKIDPKAFMPKPELFQ
ncbi:MAG: HD-GYP domain-containing protein [Magnetococcales bacterium]|nr:HD-GYP domain-containing protein [Magnetococcales bacterium]